MKAPIKRTVTVDPTTGSKTKTLSYLGKNTMAKINYDAINFKNKDVDKLSTKFKTPAPAYAQGKSTNFAGTDRKRESVRQQDFNSGMKKADQAADKAVMKDIDSFARGKAKEMNKEDRVKSREAKQYERRTTTKGRDKVSNFVDKTLGRGKYDRGSMKKNMDMGGNRSKLNVDKAGQKKQDTDCKAKRGSGKTCKPKDIGNSQWTVN